MTIAVNDNNRAHAATRLRLIREPLERELMRRLIPLPLIASLLALGVTTGCGNKTNNEPTAPQARETLKQHISRLLSGMSARDVDITRNEMSKDKCSDNKEKYLYSIKATKHLDGGDTPGLLVDMMTGQLSRIAMYEVTKYEPRVSPTTELHDKRTYTNLTLSSPKRAHIEVEGATDCLDPK